MTILNLFNLWSCRAGRYAFGWFAAMFGWFHPLQAQPPEPTFAAGSVDGTSLLQGTLRIGGASRAAVLAFPLGPGLGDGDLRYQPTLTGALAPKVGLVPQGSSAGAQDWAPALLATSGFSLAPGSLVWHFAGQGGNGTATSQAWITWTYPDGSSDCVTGEVEETPELEALLARFGYDTRSPRCLPLGQDPADLAPFVLSGREGAILLGLSDPARSAQLRGPEGEMELPSRLLVIRRSHAYEYCREGSGEGAGLVRYRLVAMRNAAGKAISFTYGGNGVDFEAAWDDQIVRVSLDGIAPAVPTPALDDALPVQAPGAPSQAFRTVLVRIRIIYKGVAEPLSYAVTAVVRPDFRTPVGTFVGGFRDAHEDPQAVPEDLPGSLQVTSVRREGAGEYLRFTYGKAAAVHHPGPDGDRAFAPTVLQEIGSRGHNLRLVWVGEPSRVLAATGEIQAWVYAVSSVEDQDTSGPDGQVATHPSVPGSAEDHELLFKLAALPGASAMPAADGLEAGETPRYGHAGGLKGGCPEGVEPPGPSSGAPAASSADASSAQPPVWPGRISYDPVTHEAAIEITCAPNPPESVAASGDGGGGAAGGGGLSSASSSQPSGGDALQRMVQRGIERSEQIARERQAVAMEAQLASTQQAQMALRSQARELELREQHAIAQDRMDTLARSMEGMRLQRAVNHGQVVHGLTMMHLRTASQQSEAAHQVAMGAKRDELEALRQRAAELERKRGENWAQARAYLPIPMGMSQKDLVEANQRLKAGDFPKWCNDLYRHILGNSEWPEELAARQVLQELEGRLTGKAGWTKWQEKSADWVKSRSFDCLLSAWKEAFLDPHWIAQALMATATPFLGPRTASNVWDSVKATQDFWPGTSVPRSFELTAGSHRIWVHANATEHMAEYATSMTNRGVNIGLVRVSTQAQLSSLQAAVKAATVDGIPFNEVVSSGGWKLKFSPPSAQGQLPALIHAVPIR